MRIAAGTCFALFAYEVGFGIDLGAAEQRITAQREALRQKRRAPRYFEFHPAPLRVTQQGEAVALGRWRSAEVAEIVLHNFGAVSVAYRIPLECDFGDLVELSETLYDHGELLADSRRRVERVCEAVRPAIDRPALAEMVETYAVFEIARLEPPCAPAELQAGQAATFARILRSERGALSADEVADATGMRIAYSDDDLAVIDWDGALLVGRELDDVRAVLEFANVELLEMRHLDQRLDDALDETYRGLARSAGRRSWFPGASRAELRRVAELQVDGAILFEGVNNALKLLGDQYLARVYRLVSARFHLGEWDASILRKLDTLESIYQKLSDAAGARRLEFLEWIVIALIAIEVVMGLWPG